MRNCNWLIGVFLAFLGFALVATEVEARRLGGARSLGAQRNIATPPPAKPAQQVAPAQKVPQAATTGSKWGPVLGGLALGGVLGYLFAGNGLAGFLLLVALALGAVMLFRALARRASPAPRPVQLAGVGSEIVAPPAPGAAPAAAGLRLPAGFDAAGFLRAAKLNFVKLQLANDAGELDEIRELTTDEMFEELSRDIETREPQPQETEVVALKADLLELASDKGRHWASVRFSGMVREGPATSPVGFEEVWNLVRPTDGSSGWLLAGIQQMH